MRYPDEVDAAQVMGLGYLGEVRQGADGNLYQLVQGVDGLGNPVRFWQKRRMRGRRMARRMAHATPTMQAKLVPLAQRLHPSHARRLLQQSGMSGYIGLGELYETPDGSIYQVEGFADEEMNGLGQAELTEMMGIGYLGEVRQGPDGNMYQWVQGVDGLGNPIGRWRPFKRLRRRLRKIGRRVKGFIKKVVKKALPIATAVTSFLPFPGARAAAAGLKLATPLLRKAGVAGYGIGELYESPDGTLYQFQGFADDEEMSGLAQGEELQGFADDDYIQGFADDEEMSGLTQDEELQGFADDDMEGLAEEDMEGFGQGYVLEDRMNGLEGYIPQQPPTTRWFQQPALAPKIWESPW